MAKSFGNDEKIKAIADRLQAELNAPSALQRPPDSITAKEYAQQSGCTASMAGDFLRKQTEAGNMQRDKIGSVFYYYFPKK
tara:strand:- start:77 stop:319 length:243 start_codon:yes stop_codon:yes gene_type:complete